MERTTSGAGRCTARPNRTDPDAELEAFTAGHGDLFAHTNTMADLNRGARGTVGELVGLEHLIGRAKEMRVERAGITA